MKTFKRIGIALVALFCCCIASAEELQDANSKDGAMLNIEESNPRTKGYRGRVEAGEITDVIYGELKSAISISTSHGYQFSPYFFLGAGIGLDYHFGESIAYMPIFANARGYFEDKKIAPFVDVKIGCSLINGKGFYFNPSAGYSFGKKKCTFNLSLGYNVHQGRVPRLAYNSHYDIIENGYNKKILHGVSLKFGVEF